MARCDMMMDGQKWKICLDIICEQRLTANFTSLLENFLFLCSYFNTLNISCLDFPHVAVVTESYHVCRKIALLEIVGDLYTLAIQHKYCSIRDRVSTYEKPK